MDPLVGAALVSGGASLLGGLFSSYGQSSANATNLKIAQATFNHNREMWNLENEYNTPKNQMARYREAGLNPNLMYGSVSSGNSNNIPQMDNVRVENAYDGFAKGLSSSVTSALDTYFNAANLDADITLKKANADKMAAEAEYIRNSKTRNTNAQTTLFGEQTFASKVRAQYDLIKTAREKFGYGLEVALRDITFGIETQKLRNLQQQEKNMISENMAREVENTLKKAQISKIEFDKMLSKMQYDLDSKIKRGALSVQQKQVLLLEKKELQRIQEWNDDYLLRKREFKLKKYDNFKSDIKAGLNFIKFW